MSKMILFFDVLVLVPCWRCSGMSPTGESDTGSCILWLTVVNWHGSYDSTAVHQDCRTLEDLTRLSYSDLTILMEMRATVWGTSPLWERKPLRGDCTVENSRSLPLLLGGSLYSNRLSRKQPVLVPQIHLQRPIGNWVRSFPSWVWWKEL